MKKIFFLLSFVFVTAIYANETKYELEVFTGSKLDVSRYFNSANLGASFGWDYLKLGMILGLGRVTDTQQPEPPYVHNAVTIKPFIVIEYPFYINNEEFEQSFAIVPTIDLGTTFITTNKRFSMNLFDFGTGLKLEYFLTKEWGVGLTPFHLTFAVGRWNKGLGITTKATAITYDLFFNLIRRF